MKNSVKIFAPATVSNVGPGFDMMGFALEKPGDILIIKPNSRKIFRIYNNSHTVLPEDPKENIATIALGAMLSKLGTSQGFDLHFEKKIKPGSGIGSSAASCTAAVFGANALLNYPFTPMELIPFALEGEKVASGSLHADNIAPAMLGGFVLIRSYNPLDIISLPPPENITCAVIHPEIEIKTSESRKMIPEVISMKKAIKQCGNLAGIISGITLSDNELIFRSLFDEFAEPHRSPHIPGYIQLKNELLAKISCGCNISGSGPSIFTLTGSLEDAEKAISLMKNAYKNLRIDYDVYISKISDTGTRIIA